MGNDGSAKAIGIRYVRLETSNGIMLILKNVKHILDIRMNLISTGKLDDEGFCNTFRDSQWKLTKGSMVVAKGKKCYSLYLMQARVIDSSINVVDDDSTVELWHNRLDHMSEKGLMILAKKNLLSSMKKGFLKRCAHCLAGKQTRVAFKTHRHTKEAQRQSGEKLKCIRTNNGGEYYGPFDEYCRQHGIRHQKTPPKTPQLNELAERMNKTLVERMKHIMTNLTLVMFETPIQVEMDDYVHKQSPVVEAPLDIPLKSYEEAMGDENKIKALKNKWVYRVKQEEHASQPCYKAKLVVKGFIQNKASLDLEIEQMDVKTTFLHGDLDKEIYMETARGFHNKRKRGLCVNVSRIDKLKKQLSKSFSMKDLGPVKKILGIRIERDRASKKLRHSPSIDKEKEDMRRVPYASAVGSLMNPMVCTRPDIAYVIGVVSRFLSNPGRLHWEAVKWIMRYLQGTSKLKLTFESGKPVLVSYTDSNMAGDVDNRRPTLGYLMTFSGGAVFWQSRLQKSVALSTTEAEYIAAAEACKELLWMKRFIHELGFKQQRYVVYCDNQSVIHLSKNSIFHARSKHIDVRYHWMRDALNDNLFELEKIHIDHNGSDMLTKSLPKEKLEVCCSIAEMASPSK
ncbi:Retrovirus-related Pol polyprotein from transposon TNT 1-94 [Vitis vinifera]|uniref:Retrovirus-related Pol polyprotein from transposon TNT 1-94 n=1 Tax=Vitis vinifera TaxID=29760 RepID=A0A438FKZ7_VITVI|nr:Retrovirus-related Pol polyprotein from transposon TNT 1-94 [Vitis vinifera]